MLAVACSLVIGLLTANADPFRPRLADGVDAELFPEAFGVLGSERLMFPVDMADWPLRITAERQLFVDDFLVADSSQVVRTLHHPERHPANPVLRIREMPWEQSIGHSVFVLRDEGGPYRMWYNLRNYVTAENGIRYRGPTCYAESDDGIVWKKPDLAIFRYGEDNRNNITLLQGTIEGLFHEPHHPDSERRYRALVWHDPRGQVEYAPREGFYLYWSSDGIHWTGDDRRCVMPNGMESKFPDELLNGVGDTTHFRWDHKLNRYVANLKILYRNPTLRTVGQSESDDLIHWTRPRMTMHRDGIDPPDTQFYEHITFVYESMWIGMPRIMRTKRTGWKQVDVELSCSRDGRHWTRVCRGQKFLPLGDPASWDSDYLIPGRPGAPFLVDDKLRFYYWGTRKADKRDGSTINWDMHIGVATLRRDGFVSLDAGKEPGELTTRPLSFTGSRLFINADVAKEGMVQVELLTRDGAPVAGYTAEDAMPVTGDATKIPVSWDDTDVVHVADGEHVRLRFRLRDAKLYSFWIE